MYLPGCKYCAQVSMDVVNHATRQNAWLCAIQERFQCGSCCIGDHPQRNLEFLPVTIKLLLPINALLYAACACLVFDVDPHYESKLESANFLESLSA